jgi:hypothetical protein
MSSYLVSFFLCLPCRDCVADIIIRKGSSQEKCVFYTDEIHIRCVQSREGKLVTRLNSSVSNFLRCDSFLYLLHLQLLKLRFISQIIKKETDDVICPKEFVTNFDWSGVCVNSLKGIIISFNGRTFCDCSRIFSLQICISKQWWRFL